MSYHEISGSYSGRERRFSEFLPPHLLQPEQSKEVSYYTRVFEANAPQVIAYHGDHPPTPSPYSPLLSQSPQSLYNRASIQSDQSRKVDITGRKRLFLVLFTAFFGILSVGLLVIYHKCLDDVNVSVINITNADFKSSNETLTLSMDFHLKIENPNLQQIKLRRIGADVNLQNATGLCDTPIQVLRIGSFDQSLDVKVAGSSDTSILIRSIFDLDAIGGASLIIESLLSGRFEIILYGSLRSSTVRILDFDSDVESSKYVPSPLITSLEENTNSRASKSLNI
eukprot:TRINITY_DN6144_c0_g1_i1.p1 TRINITY_DN6144_c0_g1~~TRINITY_DN6144_c0_g1_i1.p1  ORF type:complete len:282 (+),score=72.56 TRINITY_DN6144_c0_g1_i1:46-891(+)